MPDIPIPVSTWIEALEICEALGATLGSQATYDDDVNRLTVKLEVIEQAIACSLEAVKEPESDAPRATAHIDRAIALQPSEQLQLDIIKASYIERYAAAKGDVTAQCKAFQLRAKELQIFREQVIAPYAKKDIDGFTVVYGPLDVAGILPRPLVRRLPGSLPISADTIIHFRMPENATEQYWREQKVSARQIVRYFVEEIDDGSRDALENPRTTIDARVLRSLVLG